MSSSLRNDRQAVGGNTLVLEDGGLPATLGLRVRDPFRHEGCTFGDPTCIVDRRQDCSRQDVVYIITCNECKERVCQGPDLENTAKPTEAGGEVHHNYIGMTGSSMHARAKAHVASMHAGDRNNALARHVQNAHAGIAQSFSMSMCTTHRTVLSRYKSEAIFIEKQLPCTSMNDRIEGGHGGLIRMEINIIRN